MSETQQRTVPEYNNLEFPGPPVNLDTHDADLASRKAARDAKREYQRRCLNPAFAAGEEAKKPRYQYRVSAEWATASDGSVTEFSGEETVIAQNEDEAWARFNDVTGQMLSRNSCDKVTITKGKQVSAADALAGPDDVAPRKVKVGRQKPVMKA